MTRTSQMERRDERTPQCFDGPVWNCMARTVWGPGREGKIARGVRPLRGSGVPPRHSPVRIVDRKFVDIQADWKKHAMHTGRLHPASTLAQLVHDALPTVAIWP